MRDKTKCGCYIERPVHKQISDFVRGYVYGRTGRVLKETDTYLQGDPRKCNFYAYKRGEK